MQQPEKAVKQGYWAIVPAAGIGTRMRVETPKQYLEVAGATILEHTLDRLLSVGSIERVMVCIGRHDPHWSKLAISRDERITTVFGGAERMHSVYNALTSLEKEQAAGECYVLVHDAVRPCVLAGDIEDLIDKASQDDIGAILATPSVDTLKRVDSDFRITETLPRERYWSAQTPQMFRLSILRKCIEVLMNREQIATDESSALEASGLQPRVVEGSRENIKVTVPEDLAMVEMLLGKQKNGRGEKR